MAGGPIYDVGIHLSAVNGVSGVLAAISKQLFGLHGSVDHLNKGFKNLQLGILRAVGVASGTEMLRAIGHFEEAGEKLVHAKTVFAAGLPAMDRSAMLAAATAAAWKEAASNLNTTVTGNIESIHDLYNVVQDLPHAINLLPAFNILDNALASVKDQGGIGGAHTSENTAAAARAFELQGRTAPQALTEMANEFVKTTIALRGRVDGLKYLGAIQTAGDARLTWDTDFATKVFPALINIMGQRAGTGVNAISNNLWGGVTSSVLQGQFQEKWGLHTQADELLDRGKFKGFQPGTMWEADKFRANQLEWANDYREHLKGMGVNIDDMKVMGEVVAEIGRGNKLMKGALDELLMPQTNRQLNKEVANIGKVGADAAGYMNDNDPTAVRNAMWKQYENATEGIGQHLVQPMMDNVIKPLTGVLSSVAQWSAVHPETIKLIGEALAGLGVALVGLGTAAIVAAAAALVPGGAVALGVAALGTVIATVVGFNWDGISTTVKRAVDLFLNDLKALPGEFSAAVSGIAEGFRTEIAKLPGEVVGSIGAAISSIGAALASAISSLNPFAGGAGGGSRQAVPTPGSAGGRYHPSSFIGVPPGGHTTTIHTAVMLDGRKIAANTTHHIASWMEFPNSIGGPDTHGTWMGPGIPLADSA